MGCINLRKSVSGSRCAERFALETKLKSEWRRVCAALGAVILAGGPTRSEAPWISRRFFTLSNFHEDLHGSCLAHPSLLVIQALQRPIWCSWSFPPWNISINWLQAHHILPLFFLLLWLLLLSLPCSFFLISLPCNRGGPMAQACTSSVLCP